MQNNISRVYTSDKYLLLEFVHPFPFPNVRMNCMLKKHKLPKEGVKTVFVQISRFFKPISQNSIHYFQRNS